VRTSPLMYALACLLVAGSVQADTQQLTKDRPPKTDEDQPDPTKTTVGDPSLHTKFPHSVGSDRPPSGSTSHESSEDRARREALEAFVYSRVSELGQHSDAVASVNLPEGLEDLFPDEIVQRLPEPGRPVPSWLADGVDKFLTGFSQYAQQPNQTGTPNQLLKAFLRQAAKTCGKIPCAGIPPCCKDCSRCKNQSQ